MDFFTKIISTSEFNSIVCNKYKAEDYFFSDFNILDILKLRNDGNKVIYSAYSLLEVFFVKWEEPFLYYWPKIKSYLDEHSYFSKNLDMTKEKDRIIFFKSLKREFVVYELRKQVIKIIEE